MGGGLAMEAIVNMANSRAVLRMDLELYVWIIVWALPSPFVWDPSPSGFPLILTVAQGSHEDFFSTKSPGESGSVHSEHRLENLKFYLHGPWRCEGLSKLGLYKVLQQEI